MQGPGLWPSTAVAYQAGSQLPRGGLLLSGAGPLPSLLGGLACSQSPLLTQLSRSGALRSQVSNPNHTTAVQLMCS